MGSKKVIGIFKYLKYIVLAITFSTCKFSGVQILLSAGCILLNMFSYNTCILIISILFSLNQLEDTKHLHAQGSSPFALRGHRDDRIIDYDEAISGREGNFRALLALRVDSGDITL